MVGQCLGVVKTMNGRSVFGGGQKHEQSVSVWGWSKQ